MAYAILILLGWAALVLLAQARAWRDVRWRAACAGLMAVLVLAATGWRIMPALFDTEAAALEARLNDKHIEIGGLTNDKAQLASDVQRLKADTVVAEVRLAEATRQRARDIGDITLDVAQVRRVLTEGPQRLRYRSTE